MTSGARRRRREAARRKPAATASRAKGAPRAPATGRSLTAPGLPVVAGLTTGVALAVLAVAYDPSLFAPYYVPRLVLFSALVAALPLLLAWSLRQSPALPAVDLLDALVLGFAAWQFVAAVLSPAGSLAWVGYYNRGTGALFWCALALLFVSARRLLATRRAQLAVAACLAAALALAAVVAVLQAASVSTWWGSEGVVGGRVTGTLGNPVHLAAFGLAGVWLAAAGVESRSERSWRVVLLAAGGAGAICVVLSVSRAAYLGALAAAVYLLVIWIRERRRTAAIALCAALGVLAIGALVYAAGDAAGGTVWTRLTSVVSRGELGAGDERRAGLWQEGLAAVAARPATGFGPGAFVVADRLFGEAADKTMHPWSVASDAHSLPVELAATGGLPSLLLAIACAGALVWLSRPGAREGGEEGEPGGRPLAGRAARAYLLAAFVYLLVSPLDLAVLAPAAVAAALLCPRLTQRRFSWRLGNDGGSANRATAVVLAVAGVVLLVATMFAGQRAWRADKAFSDTARTRTWEGAGRATDLAPWEAFYALEAGARRWRSGLEAGDEDEVTQGKALLERGVRADPTAAHGYADLARLAIARGDLEEAVDQLRTGLRWNPHHPVLQGLWAVAAITAQPDDPEAAAQIATELESLPADTPDAWFWLGEYRRARGDDAGARRAREEAARLAPLLSEHRYEQRLLHSR